MRTVVIVISLAACGGGSSARTPDADPDRPDAAPGAIAGDVTVLDGGGLGHLWWPPVVFGGFPDGGPPAWYRETVAAGACRVLAYQLDFCEPPCDGICVVPATCQRWPSYRSAGVLTVTGLTEPLSLEPYGDGRYATPGGLKSPLFAVDATIAVEAGGDVIPAFTVTASGVRRLTVPALDATGRAILVDGADLTLSWPEPDTTARVHLIVHSGGAPHGTPPQYMLECDATDAGSLEIPRAAIEAMPRLGEGCPKGHDCAKLGIARYRRATTTTGSGEVALRVMNGANYLVVHDP